MPTKRRTTTSPACPERLSLLRRSIYSQTVCDFLKSPHINQRPGQASATAAIISFLRR